MLFHSFMSKDVGFVSPSCHHHLRHYFQ